MIELLLILFFVNFSGIFSQDNEDYSCMVSTSDGYVYTWKAVACRNVLADSICEDSYRVPNYPQEGSSASRPRECHTSDGEPVYGDAKTIATQLCPKACGYCCDTPDFICENQNVTINCDTITKQHCKSPKWRQVLSEECPAACGFCDLHECLDLVEGCENDSGICEDIKMQDFVEKNCKRSCGRPLKITNAVHQEL